MIDIIYEDIPYGCLPVYYTDETVEFYTVSGIIDPIEIVKMAVDRKRVVLPLFEQHHEKEFPHGGSMWKSASKAVEDNGKTIRSLKRVPQHIIQLFSNHGCEELKAVTMGELQTFVATGRKSTNFVWSRQAGYLGIKTLGDTHI